MEKWLNIRSPSKRTKTARKISDYFGRGSSMTKMVNIVLNTLKEEIKVRHLEDLTPQHREEFISILKGRVEEEEIKRGTAANYISAWNRIVEYAEKPELRISAMEHDLSRGGFEYKGRPVQEEEHKAFVGYCHQKYHKTGKIEYLALAHQAEMARAFGLRKSEAAFIKMLEKELEEGRLHLGREDQTKNGREREIPVFKREQEEAFRAAKQFVQEQKWYSLTPPEYEKKEWLDFQQKVVQEFRKEHPEYKDYSWHGERHAFAQELYEHLKEQKLEEKLQEGESLSLTKEEEREIKLQVSEALGHSRIEITKAYGV